MECLIGGLVIAGFSYGLMALWCWGNDFYRDYTYIKDSADDELALFRAVGLAAKYRPLPPRPEIAPAPENAPATKKVLCLEHKKLPATIPAPRVVMTGAFPGN